ncbi:DegV family protein [Lachnospiraceae bacterium NSJ-143]|nr:DegV family protein [Lachnospiraceae bacterium NSJ-143]
MVKVAVAADSNSGITQKEARDLGITVIPMPFTIDGETFFEDINLTQKQFYERLAGGAEIATSQPALADVTDCWNNILKTYDELVYIPMSSGLSGSCQTALMLSGDFDGRVHVVNNQRISVTQKQSVLDAMEMASAGFDGSAIKAYLEKTRFDSSIYITLETLEYLKKGGRVTPAAAALASLLKIRPVLQIQGEKLDAFSKARTKKLAKKIMINAVLNDMKNRFGSNEAGDDVWIHVAYSGTDSSEAEEFKKEIQLMFPSQPVITDPLALSICCHIGPGALAATCMKKLNINNI